MTCLQSKLVIGWSDNIEAEMEKEELMFELR